MHRHRAISETHEMYLKMLYTVRDAHEVARVRDLADGLGLTPGTVSNGLKKLEQLDLVDHQRYGVVALTDTGHRIAECVHRRYETLRDVLVEIFGIDPDTAAVDACMMEHAVSPATANAMRALLTRVRGNKLSLPRPRRAGAEDPCRRCEAQGACRAVPAEMEARDVRS
jgi:DtxR family Mn-dependent transcriptional regulator